MYVEQAKCYSAMGDAYRVAFDLDIAEEMYRAAMKLNIKHKSYEALAGDYINIGVVYNARERYDVALSWYNDAINIGEKIDSLLCKAIALKKIALCYQQQCNLPKAINKYNLAYKAYAEIGNRITSYNVCYTKLLRYKSLFKRAGILSQFNLFTKSYLDIFWWRNSFFNERERGFISY